jgi:hypothetical protein
MEAHERYRLSHFNRGETPNDRMYATVTFGWDGITHDCVNKVTSVMQLVADHQDNWPEDSYWKEQLPEWLLATFKVYSEAELAEILSDRSLWSEVDWTFGSWLDRMRDRDWEWWSFEVSNDAVIIILAVDGDPFSAGALEHLIVAAGGKQVRID